MFEAADESDRQTWKSVQCEETYESGRDEDFASGPGSYSAKRLVQTLLADGPLAWPEIPNVDSAGYAEI